MDFNIKDVVKQDEYKFLREGDLSNRLMLLTLGGSISYGTNVPGSDVDIRGIALNSKKELFTFRPEELYEDVDTDTVIYTFNKIFYLLRDCNPNTIEMLYTKDEHRIVNDLGQMLLDNKHKFLSQQAFYAYNGYINAQIHRIKNAMRKDGGLSLEDELMYERARLNDLIVHFNTTRASFDKSSMEFIQKDGKILMNCHLDEYPAGDLSSIFSELTNVMKSWNKAAKLSRRELDSKKLCKFSMHILRLLYQEYQLLSTGTFSTFVDNKKRLDEMMKTRTGYFLEDELVMSDGFFDIVNDYQKEVEYAKIHTVLPEKPDYEELDNLFITINKKIVTRDYDKIKTKDFITMV